MLDKIKGAHSNTTDAYADAAHPMAPHTRDVRLLSPGQQLHLNQAHVLGT
jgi:hypothetical protein